MLLRSNSKRPQRTLDIACSSLTAASPKQLGQYECKTSLYTYAPLKSAESEFRILELFPARDSEAALSGILRIENLDDLNLEPYEAISYTWGTDDKEKCIELDGQMLRIGRNLDAALRQFRKTRRCRRLWADAICINQADTAEKSYQVSRMTEIYRISTCTLAWLGAPYAKDDVNTKVHIAMLLRDRRRYGTIHDPIDKGLLSSPYCTRRWCIQEINVARKVEFRWCGHYISTAHLKGRVGGSGDIALFKMLEVGQPFDDVELVWLAMLGRVPPILIAMDKFDEFECKDARDRITTLNWLCNSDEKYYVDYGTASVRDVYHGFAALMAKQSIASAIWLLQCAGGRTMGIGACDSRRADWQSWVPDWRRPRLQADSEVVLDLDTTPVYPGVAVTVSKPTKHCSAITVEQDGHANLRMHFECCRSASAKLYRLVARTAKFSSVGEIPSIPEDKLQDRAKRIRIREGDHIIAQQGRIPFGTLFDVAGNETDKIDIRGSRGILLRPDKERSIWTVVGLVKFDMFPNLELSREEEEDNVYSMDFFIQ